MATVVVRHIAGASRRNVGLATRWCSSLHGGRLNPHAGLRHGDRHPACRSMLFVPGDSEKKLKKSVGCGADLCILDLEDGVGHGQKAAARETLSKVIPTLDYPATTSAMIRLNACTAVSAEGKSEFEADVAMLSALSTLPSSVGLSKVDNVEDVEACMAYLDKTMPRGAPALGIFAMIESPESIVTLERICAALVGSAQADRFLPAGLIFGHMDYCTNAGIDTAHYDRSKFMYAEQKLVTVAKAFRLQAVDCVYTVVKDLDGLRNDCAHGSGTGFTGKTAIHPSHVDVINEVFSPPPQRIAWARGLLDAFARHQAEGQAVFVYEGELVDEPVFRRARSTLAAADRLKTA